MGATTTTTSSSSSSSSYSLTTTTCSYSSRYALGLCFIVLVSLIWSAASVLVQYLYHDRQFDSPFLLTYIGTSLFIILLPIRCIWERKRKIQQSIINFIFIFRQQQQQQPVRHDDNDDDVVIPWSHHHQNVFLTSSSHAAAAAAAAAGGYTPVQSNHAAIHSSSSLSPSSGSVQLVDSTGDNHNHIQQDDSCSSSSSYHSHVGVHHHHHHHLIQQEEEDTTDNNNDDRNHTTSNHKSNSHNNNKNSSASISSSQQQQQAVIEPQSQQQQQILLLSHQDHIRIALRLAPVWFFANWSYNASLAYTSISSSTVLASTSSLFTFLIASTCCADESFTTWKLIGVLLGMTGSILTGWHDLDQQQQSSFTNSSSVVDTAAFKNTTIPLHRFMHWMDSTLTSSTLVFGDLLSLLSAIGYAVQVVLIRVLCPRDEQAMSMQLLLGYVGLFNMIILSPIAVYQLLHVSSTSGGNNNNNNNSTTFEFTWTILGCLVLKGLLDNVLSDYLWARAVVLTTATVATVGLGLTIPLAFASDLLFGSWLWGKATTTNNNNSNNNNGGSDVLSRSSIIGAMCILLGFVLVNIGNNDNDLGDDNHDDTPPTTTTTTSTQNDNHNPRHNTQQQRDEHEPFQSITTIS